MIVNVIVAEADFAAEIGALPAYEGTAIGGTYTPPPPEPEPAPAPTQLDRIEAQVTYTAMMTDTLMEG